MRDYVIEHIDHIEKYKLVTESQLLAVKNENQRCKGKR